MTKKHNIEYVRGIIKNKGGDLLSNVYINNETPLLIRCKNGHTFNKRFGDIITNKWCRECANIRLRKKFALSYEFVKNEIEKRDGILLEYNYINAHTVMSIKCKNNHLFEMNYCNIKNNKWCNECSSEKTQNYLANIFRQIYKNYTLISNYNKFDWLKTSRGGKQELDIYLPELKIAIEYDGEQHFKPVKFSSKTTDEKANKIFKRTKQLDKLKNKKIKQHPEDVKYFIRFNYKEKNKLNEDYVREKLIQEGIPIENSSK